MCVSAGRLKAASKARRAGINYSCSCSRSRLIVAPKCRRIALLRAQHSDEQLPDVQAPLLSALISIGINGTIAVTGATLSGIKLFNEFNWNQSDIVLAVKLYSAVLALESLLLAPRWGIPKSLLAQQQAGAHQKPSTSAAGTGLTSVQQQQTIDMSAVKDCSRWSLASWQLMLALYTSVLGRPQTQQLPKLTNLGLVTARETSKELCQRGFLLTALAGWLTDRFYEAGFDDVITVTQGLDLTLYQLGFWVASLIITAGFAPAGFIAAEEAAEAVSGALLLQTEVGQALATAEGGGSSNSAAGEHKDRSGSNAWSVVAQDQLQQQQQQQGDVSLHTSQQQQQQQEGESSDDTDDDDVTLDPDILEYRLFKATEECINSSPAKLAYGVTLTKELARVVLANVAFVATGGNLSATLSCALVSNYLLLLYGLAAANTRSSAQQPTG